MRRLWCVAILILAMALAAPSKAHAGWLGYVARLSGPGPFGGYWAVRFQVLCFNDSSITAEDTIKLNASMALTSVVLQPPPAATVAAAPAARTSADTLKRLQAAIGEADKAARAALAMDELDRDLEHTARTKINQVIAVLDTALDELGGGPGTDNTRRVLKAIRANWVDTRDAMQVRLHPPVVFAPGLVANAGCNDDEGLLPRGGTNLKGERRPQASLVVDYRHMKTTGPNPDYANGNQIYLDVVVPRVSWRLFSNQAYDIVDLQSGAGLATFGSDGFERFNKLIIEPVRYEFHFPSKWTRGNSWKARLLRVPSYGVGLTMFPQGFAATDFNGTGPGARDIQGKEGVLEQSFVLNIGPLIGL